MNSDTLRAEAKKYQEVLKVRAANRTEVHKEIVASEIKNRQMLKQRGPDEWNTAIRLIEDEQMRKSAACVVWWDFFGSRTINERWNHLDDLVGKVFAQEDIPNADSNKLAVALNEIGYSAYEAVQRATKLSRKD